MFRRLLLAFAVLLGVSAYPLSGFKAAWEIREAARAGDSVTLARRVDFAAVRQSLKRSAGETRQIISELSEAAGVPKPGLWQRIKAAAVPFLADPLIDRYVTPEGAPQIWAWRQTWREKVRPSLLGEPVTPLNGTWLAGSSLDRGLSVARRLERVAFASPRRLEIELRDRYDAAVRWKAAMELRDFSWMLVEVHLQRPRPAPAPVALKAWR